MRSLIAAAMLVLAALPPADGYAGKATDVPAAHCNKSPRPGHYIALGKSDGRSIISEVLQPGVMGVQIRYDWNELEAAEGEYDFTAIRADLEAVSRLDGRLVVFVEDKTFDGDRPTPDYLAELTLPNQRNGYTAIRWDPRVIERFSALLVAIGRAFDCHPGFEGIAIQETALGLSDEMLERHGYTPPMYRDGLVAVLLATAASMPNSRVFWYLNFLPGGQKYLATVAAAVAPAGVAMGGPDVLPDNPPLQKLVYPLFDRFDGKLPLFSSIQHNSYAHRRADGRADPPYWTLEELFLFARDDLHVDYLFWNRKTWRRPGDSYDWTDALPVIRKYADFAD